MAIYINNINIDPSNRIHRNKILKFFREKSKLRLDFQYIEYDPILKSVVKLSTLCDKSSFCSVLLDFTRNNEICINPFSFYDDSIASVQRSTSECYEFLHNLVSEIRQNSINSILNEN